MKIRYLVPFAFSSPMGDKRFEKQGMQRRAFTSVRAALAFVREECRIGQAKPPAMLYIYIEQIRFGQPFTAGSMELAYGNERKAARKREGR